MAAPGAPNWQAQILRGIGAPVTPQNMMFVNDWAKAEGGGATNNPFNTTEPGFGATDNYNPVGVKDYATPQGGIQATVNTLENGRYGNIIGALRQGTDAKAAAQALANSPWGTGSLVLKMLGGAPAAAGPSASTPQQTPRLPQPAATRKTANPNIAAALRLLGFNAPPAAKTPGLVAPTVATTRTPLPMTNGETLPLTGLVAGNSQGENPRFLQDLARLAQYEKAPVDINSGYRSYAKQAALYANRGANPNPVAPPGRSLHEQGLAADGTVNGIPLGTLPAAVLARFGLATVPGDPVHVQVAR
jgi:hypothetical protein